MNAIIVSDLHIGSRYFLISEFERFLETVSDDSTLILNGDILDNAKAKLTLPHQRIIDRIERLSFRQHVIWVQGNHDNGFVPDTIGNIEFRPIYQIDNRLLIAHGHDFDEIMPRNRFFMSGFKLLHQARIALGTRPVHVAHYAKKWKRFYKVLRNNVMKNAVLCAREQGYDTVVCGHTHFAEDRIADGIRYINTGAWTEHPPHYLRVTDHDITLTPFEIIERSDTGFKHPTGYPPASNPAVDGALK